MCGEFIQLLDRRGLESVVQRGKVYIFLEMQQDYIPSTNFKIIYLV